MKLIASNVELSLEEIKGYLGDNGVTAEFVDIDYNYFINVIINFLWFFR